MAEEAERASIAAFQHCCCWRCRIAVLVNPAASKYCSAEVADAKLSSRCSRRIFNKLSRTMKLAAATMGMCSSFRRSLPGMRLRHPVYGFEPRQAALSGASGATADRQIARAALDLVDHPSAAGLSRSLAGRALSRSGVAFRAMTLGPGTRKLYAAVLA